MKKLKMGTTAMGLILGGGLACAGVLVMLIGFWKALILICLFAIGFFVGRIENPGEYIRDKANRLIPNKSAKPINIKEEIAREQAENIAAMTETDKRVYEFKKTEE